MKLRRTEIGIWRIMLIEAPHAGIAKQDASAPVRLQAVFVRINYDGIGFPNTGKCALSFCAEIFCQDKITAVGSVRMNPESILLTQHEYLAERIHGSGCGRSHRCHDRSDISALQPL